MNYRRVFQTSLMGILGAASVHAGLGTQAIKGIGKAATREVGEEALEVGAKNTAKKLAQELVTEGTESVARRSGTAAIQGMGDDVLRVAAGLSDDAVAGLGKLSARNARRLQMLAGEIEQTGRGPELLALIGKDGAGDQVIDFLWRNKGTLVGGAVISTLLLNPEAALAAGSDVANTIIAETAEHVVQPVMEGTIAHVAAPVLGVAFPAMMMMLLFAGIVLVGWGYLYLRHAAICASLMRVAGRTARLLYGQTKVACMSLWQWSKREMRGDS